MCQWKCEPVRKLSFARKCLLNFLAIGAVCLLTAGTGLALNDPPLFGYNESQQFTSDIQQKLYDVIKRHLEYKQKDEHCDSLSAQECRVRTWNEFLKGLEGKPPLEQISAVNMYVNRKRYKPDLENYGVSDYWATPEEFLYRSGDCEDYSIIKLLSLEQLGFSTDSMRIVVLMDTKLRIPHAVLAVYINDDILILDNQTQDVVSHRKLSHYVPVYSLNESHWWIHSSR